jgi:hypothetical protein
MLASFAALNAGQAINSPEQGGEVPCRAAGLCASARRQFGRVMQALIVSSAEAVGFAEPIAPGQ